MPHVPSRLPTRWVHSFTRAGFFAVALAGLAFGVPARAAGDRLLGTWGVTQLEGAGGGGLTPWALIAGSGSANQIGATAAATRWSSQGGFELRTVGVAVGLHDRIELSAARWRFGLSDTVPGQSIGLDVLGAKWRVLGDAVYDQDRWWPQLAIGVQAKRLRDPAVPTALGARRHSDVDVYLAASKVWLGGVAGANALANLTLRATRANQFGLLGFGGDRRDAHQLVSEGSLAVLPRDDLAVGVEWRHKPDNLSAFAEQAATDVFVAWFPSRRFSLTLAHADLGRIADKAGQRGWVLSAQAAF